jgi:hypothetical protein
MEVVESSLNGVVPRSLASDAEAVFGREPDLAGEAIVSAPSRRFDRRDANLSTALSGVRISPVIPTLNEAENLPHDVIERIPDGLHEVIVADGHSTDETIAVACRLRPDVRIVERDRAG